MNTDTHRFCGLDRSLSWLGSRPLFRERILPVAKRGSAHSPSGFICVHSPRCRAVAAGPWSIPPLVAPLPRWVLCGWPTAHSWLNQRLRTGPVSVLTFCSRGRFAGGALPGLRLFFSGGPAERSPRVDVRERCFGGGR